MFSIILIFPFVDSLRSIFNVFVRFTLVSFSSYVENINHLIHVFEEILIKVISYSVVIIEVKIFQNSFQRKM